MVLVKRTSFYEEEFNNFFVGGVKMKKFVILLLMVFLFVGSAANAATPLVVDDFESYADSTALQAVWVMNLSSDITTETLEPVLNGNSMLITNAEQGPAYYSQTKLTLLGAGQG